MVKNSKICLLDIRREEYYTDFNDASKGQAAKAVAALPPAQKLKICL
jgi:hypothetical protein